MNLQKLQGSPVKRKKEDKMLKKYIQNCLLLTTFMGVGISIGLAASSPAALGRHTCVKQGWPTNCNKYQVTYITRIGKGIRWVEKNEKCEDFGAVEARDLNLDIDPSIKSDEECRAPHKSHTD